jgi:hypothetical protein
MSATVVADDWPNSRLAAAMIRARFCAASARCALPRFRFPFCPNDASLPVGETSLALPGGLYPPIPSNRA